jgi:hypothetical protein
MHAVYSFYNVPGPHGMAAILNDALILAKQVGAPGAESELAPVCIKSDVLMYSWEAHTSWHASICASFSSHHLQKGADVFNCLDLMENSAVLRELKFGPGDGSLQYYLYNWQCPPVSSDAVGLVLL